MGQSMDSPISCQPEGNVDNVFLGDKSPQNEQASINPLLNIPFSIISFVCKGSNYIFKMWVGRGSGMEHFQQGEHYSLTQGYTLPRNLRSLGLTGRCQTHKKKGSEIKGFCITFASFSAYIFSNHNDLFSDLPMPYKMIN